MSSPTILYFTSILVTCVLSGGLAAYAWRQRQVTGSSAYARLALSEALWALAEILSVISPTAAWALFWFQVRYLFGGVIGVCWFVFALEYSGFKVWLSKRMLAGLCIIPLFTQALLWSNSLHGLWALHDVGFTQKGPFWIADIAARIPGLGYLTNSFYTLLLTLAGIGLLFLGAWKMRREFVPQALMLAGAGLTALFFLVNSLFNLLPKMEFNPFTPGLGLSVLLIALAVFRFQFLKRAPAAGSVPYLTDLHEPDRRSLAFLLLIFLFLASGISASAYLSYTNYARHFRAQVEENLSAISGLKVSELQDWRAERLGDAEVLRRSPVLAALVRTYFENPADARSEKLLQAWLDSLHAAYDYQRVSLLDLNGVERLAAPVTSEPVAAHLAEDAVAVLATGQVSFIDFHRDALENKIYLAILAPVFADEAGSRPLGVVVLRIDPETTLYPYLQQWPIPSESAETLLVRREGDSVLFLSPVRFNPDAALSLRFPLTATDVLAVKAVLGQTGVADGIDYRDETVVGALAAVPGTPWFLVARMDLAEVYAPVRERLWETGLFFGLILLTSSAGLLIFWRQQRVRYYQGQMEMVEALRASEAKYRGVVETANEGIVFLDNQARMTFVNPQMAAMIGYTVEEMLGQRLVSFLVEDQFGDHEAQMEIRAQGKGTVYERCFRRKDGGEHWMLVSSKALMDADGKFAGSFKMLSDITERKRAEQQLANYAEQLEAMVDERTRELQTTQEKLVRQERLVVLGQLAGNVGHELRNPLGVISNAVYFLKLIQPDADVKVKEYLDIIVNETRSADKIITDLLDFSRIKSQGRKPVAVAEVIGRVIERFPGPAGVTVTIDLPEDLPLVYADAQQMVQVIGNLVVNAYQAMPEGGQLAISGQGCVVNEQAFIAIGVQDSGVGIAPENMSRIFESLFTTKLHGIGLGLAVSEKLAEANEAWIEVQSELGKGSRFTTYWPVVRQ